MKQTALEWLFNQIKKDIIGLEYEYADELIQAKEMEKENTIAFADKYDAYVVQGGTLTAEQYYNETYGGDND